MKVKFIRPFVAMLLSLVLGLGVVTVAFAEEEPATTSTTKVTEQKSEDPGDKTSEKASDKEEEKTSDKDASSTTKETPTSKKDEESTTKEAPTSKKDEEPSSKSDEKTEPDESTTEPTTEPVTEPDFAPDYTGIADTTYNGEKAWWRVENGAVQPKANGVFQNEYGWWYVKNGKVDFKHTGVDRNEYGWWRVEDGKVNFKANSVYQNEYGWWYVKDGKVDFKHTGVDKNEYGWWRVEDGKVNFKATGIYKNGYGWWRVKNGKVDFKATGIFKNEYGSWYVKNGKVDFKKTGTVVQGKASYTVQEGKVTGVTMKVPLVNQNPNYPTGCEAASATMFLKFYGYDISLKQMVNTIPRENLRTVNGKRYGPRITEKFVGDPRSGYTSKNPGYGAFAPVVTKSINNVISNQFGKNKAVDKTGAAFNDLIGFLNEGKPVIVWSTYNLQTPKTVNAWYIATSTGPEYFSYPRGTHVCVLVGYDAKNVYLADPYGAKTKTFKRAAFNDKYKLLGRQAIVMQ